MGQLSAVDVLGCVERGIAQTQVIGWDADVWRRDLADVDATFEVPAVLDRLIASATAHGGLTRSDVVDIGGDDEVHLLVASMAWGFGPLGYGAFRTAQMLDGAPEVIRGRLADIGAAARTGEPREAFRSLFQRGRAVVRQLSIAMGTKYLYFASSDRQPDGPRPLVYDVNIFRAVRALADGPSAPPDPRRYTKGVDYERVVCWIHEQAGLFDVAPDDVEFALFEHGKRI